MSLPDGWIKRPVIGSYVRFDGTYPAAGAKVYFNAKRFVLVDDTVVVPVSQAVTLVLGRIPDGFQLPATNDPAADPTGWAYEVIEAFPGGRDPFWVFIDYDGPGIDMATVAPVVPPPELDSTRGPRGYPGRDGINGQTSFFPYNQNTPSDSWVVAHGLQRKPSVTVKDSAGNTFVPVWQDIDENTLVITFTHAMTGSAYCI